MTINRLAAVGITVLALLTPGAGFASTMPQTADTWSFTGLSGAERSALQTDLGEVVPAARPVVDRLAGLVAVDPATGRCQPPAASCSFAHEGAGGRWGIHLDRQTLSATYPSNRFLVYHEIGHAEWGLMLDDSARQAFVDAVKRALRGRPCVNGLGQPCAPIGEMFADEFARWAGGFASSMSDYWTPPLFDPQTFAALVGVRSEGGA